MSDYAFGQSDLQRSVRDGGDYRNSVSTPV